MTSKYSIPYKMGLLGLILVFMNVHSAFGQESNEQKVFKKVEEPPQFPGGRDSLKSFLNAHLKYPYDDKMAGREGRVLISFVVEVDGSVSDIQTEADSDPAPSEEMVQEALRVFALMPSWIPGKQRDQEVRVRHHLPITFSFYTGRKLKHLKKGKR